MKKAERRYHAMKLLGCQPVRICAHCEKGCGHKEEFCSVACEKAMTFNPYIKTQGTIEEGNKYPCVSCKGLTKFWKLLCECCVIKEKNK